MSAELIAREKALIFRITHRANISWLVANGIHCATSTIDWLISVERVEATLPAIRRGIKAWPGGVDAARRKEAIFDDRLIELALKRLADGGSPTAH